MATIADFLGITELKKQLTEINHKLDHVIMDSAELTTKLTEAGDKLEKAKAEILAEIEKIQSGGALTPEAQAAVERLQSIAQALDDIVPDVPENPEA